MSFALGVDGGGTTVRAAVLDSERNELARAEAPGAVLTSRDPHPAVEAVRTAVTRALAEAGASAPVGALCAGLAGAGSSQARDAARTALARAGLARLVSVTTDVDIAFRSAFGDGEGLLLISGTGSIAHGRTRAGETIRVGGWGRWLGDEGSGHAIGVAALRAVTRADDGRGPPTAMTALTSEHLGLADVADLVRWIESASKADVAGLTQVVLSAADQNDSVAEKILGEAVAQLEGLVLALVQRSGPWAGPPELALWGGLIGPTGPLAEPLRSALASAPVVLVDREIDPALGAAEMALRAMGAV